MEETKKLDISKPLPGQKPVDPDPIPMFDKILKSMKESKPIEVRKPNVDLHEVGLFINSLNAMEGRCRHEGNYDLEVMLRKAQEIIFELLGELEDRQYE